MPPTRQPTAANALKGALCCLVALVAVGFGAAFSPAVQAVDARAGAGFADAATTGLGTLTARIAGLCDVAPYTLIGLALVGVALVRAWLLASSRRSVVYVWPALMLVVIAVTSFAESFALGEGGWMLLVVCAVKAARDMSWRDALAAGRPPAPTHEELT